MGKWFIYRPHSEASDTMSDKAKLEYIWLDGYEPTQNMRSKTMVRSNFTGTLEECPIWMFDGSSNFNQPIGNWNVSKVIDMRCLTYEAIDFNQPI